MNGAIKRTITVGNYMTVICDLTVDLINTGICTSDNANVRIYLKNTAGLTFLVKCENNEKVKDELETLDRVLNKRI